MVQKLSAPITERSVADYNKGEAVKERVNHRVTRLLESQTDHCDKSHNHTLHCFRLPLYVLGLARKLPDAGRGATHSGDLHPSPYAFSPQKCDQLSRQRAK